jgi:hypothetical protein
MLSINATKLIGNPVQLDVMHISDTTNLKADALTTVPNPDDHVLVEIGEAHESTFSVDRCIDRKGQFAIGAGAILKLVEARTFGPRSINQCTRYRWW